MHLTYIDANQILPRTFGVDTAVINFLGNEFIYRVNEMHGQMNEPYLRPILVSCHAFNVMTMGDKRRRWSRGSVLAFRTQVRGFKPGRSRRIFRVKKSKAVGPMS